MANLNSSIINGFLRVTGKLKVGSLEIESNELVTNLNADLLDGKQGSAYASSTDVANLTEQVNTNTGNILTNMEDIQDNTEQIGTNKNNITTLTTRVATAEGNITTNKNDINSLKTKTDATNANVTTLTGKVTTNTNDIAALVTKTNTTNTNVANVQAQANTNASNIKTNQDDIAALKTKTDTTNANVENNTERIDKILAGTAEIPSVGNAELAENANKLGGQLPAYYAKATDLNNYLPLTGGTLSGKTVVLGTAASASFWVRGIMGCNSEGTSANPLYLNYNNSQPVYINGDNIVYHAGNIPKASTTAQGIVKLNNTRTSTSTTEAATAAALKSAYDTVNGALTTHKNDTDVHLTTTDRTILNKANKFKGYYETETALNSAHATGEAGDYAIVNTTDTVWIWDADKEGGAGWKDGAGKGSVISVNNLTGEVVLTKSNIGLGNVDNTSDKNKPVSTAQQAALNLKVNKAGDTMTGNLVLPKLIVQGTNTTNETRYITSDSPTNLYFSTNGSTLLCLDGDTKTVRSGTSAKGTIDLGSSSYKWRNLWLAGDANVALSITAGTAITSGTVITAGTDLKTKSGIVNFNDKVNVKYNATSESIDFIFV